MRPRSTHGFVGAVTAALALLLAAPAHAQDRLFVFGQEVGTHGHFGQKLGDAPPWIRRSTDGDPEFVGGGRYVKTAEHIVVGTFPTERWVLISRAFDTFTGREIPLPSNERVVADPIRPRVFVLNGQDVRAVDLDTGQSTVLASARSVPNPPGPFGTPALPTAPPEAQYAPGPSHLFVRRAAAAGTTWELAVLDVTTGALVRTLPDFGPTGFGNEWIVTTDGTRLFAIGGGTFATGILGVRAIDAMTGAVVATTAPTSGRLRWDDVFRRLYIVTNLTGALKAFDRQLTPLGQTDGGYCFSNVRVSPHTGRLYHLRAAGGGGSYYGAIDTRLEVFDGGTGARLADASVTGSLGFGTDRPACGDYTMLLATAPGVPRSLTAAVSGRDVTLTWTNVGDASAFVLDVGLAPGRSDVTFGIGATSPVTIANAPPGTYYLRVRGTNAFGVSQPSNETAVVVR